jgi:hypothetical protein
VTALKLLDPGGEQVALARLAALMTPAGWNTPLEMETGSAAPVNDLVLGTAGVVLAAVWAGGEHARDIATIGGGALLRAADHTPGGLDWAMLQAARTMGDALAERAIRDEAGAWWRFLEHRRNPPLLPPGTSWMQGAAGIAAFLLRLARAVEGGLDTPVADRPDQWWGVPARLRTVHLARSAQAGEPGR